MTNIFTNYQSDVAGSLEGHVDLVEFAEEPPVVPWALVRVAVRVKPLVAQFVALQQIESGRVVLD